jgi:hypothetical protein
MQPNESAAQLVARTLRRYEACHRHDRALDHNWQPHEGCKGVKHGRSIMKTKVPQCACLDCGKSLDAATSIFCDARPTAADITICIYCGHIMMFTNGLALRNPTREEQIEIAGDKRILAIQRARKEP